MDGGRGGKTRQSDTTSEAKNARNSSALRSLLAFLAKLTILDPGILERNGIKVASAQTSNGQQPKSAVPTAPSRGKRCAHQKRVFFRLIMEKEEQLTIARQLRNGLLAKTKSPAEPENQPPHLLQPLRVFKASLNSFHFIHEARCKHPKKKSKKKT